MRSKCLQEDVDVDHLFRHQGEAESSVGEGTSSRAAAASMAGTVIRAWTFSQSGCQVGLLLPSIEFFSQHLAVLWPGASSPEA